MNTRGKKVVKRLHHVCFKHNSLVDFSFMDEKQSANALTLTKLNSLFGKVADRNEMGIRADKLFQLILKMDINKLKLEWYRRKLGIVTDDDGTLKYCSGSRIISRGPFIAIFKHESITFVNVLENVARPLINRRRKRMSKGTSVSSGIHTNRYTVKSAPVKSSNNKSCRQKLGKEGNNSSSCTTTTTTTYDDDEVTTVSCKLSKRLKREDKTGMIIVTKIEDDAISTVSTSPTSDGSTTALASPDSANATMAKPFNLGNDGSTSTPSSRRVKTRRSHSSRKSSRKDRKRESLRPVKSMGENSGRHEGDHDNLSAMPLFSDQAKRIQTENVSSSVDDKEKGHDRSPSNTDTVDIREVLHEYTFPEDGSNCNYFLPAHLQPNDIINQGHLFHPVGRRGQFIATSQSRFPSKGNSYYAPQNAPYEMYSLRKDAFPNLCWEDGPQYQFIAVNDNAEHDECFLLKGLASLIKKLLGIGKRRELYVMNSSMHNHFVHDTPNQWVPYREFGDFQAPSRPRTRSRVFSDSSNDTLDSVHTAADSEPLESEMQATQVHKEKHDEVCSMPLRNVAWSKYTLQTGLNEQAWKTWKAGGPKIHKQQQSSIVDDFTSERPYDYNKDIDIDKNNIAAKKLDAPHGKRILQELKYNKEKPGRPQSLRNSSRSKTEGTLGTRYSSIQSICRGKLSGKTIHSETVHLGNSLDPGDSFGGYFHYR